MKRYELIRSLLLGNRSWEQFSILLARVSLGTFFAISGGNKLFVASRTRQMYETLAGAGIPFPHFMTYFISSVEFISGCLLVIGLISGLCCAGLIIQMIVAITTVQLATIPTGLSFLDWLDDLLYLPESMYIIIMIWLICSGPGRVSVDYRIARALGYQGTLAVRQQYDPWQPNELRSAMEKGNFGLWAKTKSLIAYVEPGRLCQLTHDFNGAPLSPTN